MNTDQKVTTSIYAASITSGALVYGWTMDELPSWLSWTMPAQPVSEDFGDLFVSTWAMLPVAFVDGAAIGACVLAMLIMFVRRRDAKA
jgi:hypothetical protein